MRLQKKIQAEFSAKAIRGQMARRKGSDTTPPHGPPGSGAGCYRPHAVLTVPVTALILYIQNPSLIDSLIFFLSIDTAIMLRAKLIPQVLNEINADGVKGTLLMTIDGSLLGASGEGTATEYMITLSVGSHIAFGAGMEGIYDNVVGAIVSNIWSDLDKSGRGDKQAQQSPQDAEPQLRMMIFDMEVSTMHRYRNPMRLTLCFYTRTVG
jgi:hypothetical protein